MLEELITKETFQWSEEVLDWQKQLPCTTSGR